MRCTFLLLALAVATGHAQSPDREALVTDYIAAFNAGEAAMRAFFEAHADPATPVAARLERYTELKSELGALSLRRIVQVAPDAVTAEIAGRGGGAATFVFQLTGDPPRLRGIQVRLGGPPGGEGPAGPPLDPRDERTSIADARLLVDKAAAADDFSGVVLVGRHGQAVWSRAVGAADKSAGTPNALDTRFNVGSIGKSFTTVAVAQLVAAGALTLDDTVGKFLPDYPNPTVREKVTVRHLLEMQSGIGDIFGPHYRDTPKVQLQSLRDYLPLFANEPLHFEPGQGREYSNGGFVVLGLIVEKASGRGYDEYVHEHVFDRAGMRDTGFPPQSLPCANRATGYTTRLGTPRRPNAETLPERGSSAGGAYLTAPDLLRYAQALGDGRLAAPGDLQRVGHGGRGMGIAGGAPGLNATLDSAVNDYDIIVMSNYDPPSAERLARELRRLFEAVKH